ncbi:MAG: hypothetical protein GEU80_01920 [Dehalococcoidia bacterium]|nr:hypothetical protein [Dehalococcoidia bacterium]
MTGRPPTRPSKVTRRQREVARLVAEGRTNPEIADALGISLDGAKYHVSELLTRLNLERREGIAEWYATEGRRSVLDRLRSLVGLRLLFGAGAGVVATAGVIVLFAALSGNGMADADPETTPTPTADVVEPPPVRATVIDGLPENLDTATLLQDGRVLLGTAEDGALFIYDPRDGSVAAAGSLLEPRTAYTATLLPDGRVAFLGGSTGEEVEVEFEGREVSAPRLGALEIYDPATGVSEHVADAPMLNELVPAESAPIWFLQGHSTALLPGGHLLAIEGNIIPVVADPASGEFEIVEQSFGGAEDRLDFQVTRSTEGVVITYAEWSANAYRFDPRAATFELAAELPHVAVEAAFLPDGGLLVLGRAVETPAGLRAFTEEERREVEARREHAFVEGAVHVLMLADVEAGTAEIIGDPIEILPWGNRPTEPSFACCARRTRPADRRTGPCAVCRSNLLWRAGGRGLPD